MCKFADKICNYVPCPMYVYVYNMQYISFALYVLFPIALPATFSLCHIPDSLVYIPYMQYSLFHNSHPLFIIPYSPYMPYSRFMYSIFHACAL